VIAHRVAGVSLRDPGLATEESVSKCLGRIRSTANGAEKRPHTRRPSKRAKGTEDRLVMVDD